MKISLISKTNSWEDKDLIAAAKELNVEVEVLDNLTYNNLDQTVSNSGDIVIYRSSSLSKTDKVSFLGALHNKGKIVVNLSYITKPMLPYKSYQQVIVKNIKEFKGINTYRFKTIDELKSEIGKGLNYPIIAKPDWGKMGKGIIFLKEENDLLQLPIEELKEFIFQNFIENTGDYRIIVICGKPIGILKRVAKEGNFLNNISQGGSGYKIEEEKLRNKLFRIASKVAEKFDLLTCGVDVIEDKNGNFYFMEVNTAPQWGGDQGFQSITGVSVSKAIINYFKNYYDAINAKNAPELATVIKRHMFDLNVSLGTNQFHYLSRISLWQQDQEHRNTIATLEDSYFELIKNRLEKVNETAQNKDEQGEEAVENSDTNDRKIYFDRYPLLRKAVPLLFKVLFVETIYNKDVKEQVMATLNLDELAKTYQNLYKDIEAVKSLSTHAINFFYLTRNLLGENKFKELGLEINENYILEIAKTRYSLNNKKDLKNLIYLLTHCVIGQSKFYAKKVDEDIYKEMIRYVEEVILNNYINISLDNKFEFLVCAKIVDYSVSERLQRSIEIEALNSISDIGPFIVDKYNLNNPKRDYIAAEHRNVLFIMANSDFKLRLLNTSLVGA